MRTMREVASTVRKARRDCGLTQAELAHRIGVGRDWVVRLEQGSPRLEVAKVLDALTALGLSLTATPLPPDVPDPFTDVFEALQ